MMRYNPVEKRRTGGELSDDTSNGIYGGCELVSFTEYTLRDCRNSNAQVCLIRAPLLSLLSVDAGPVTIFQPFKSPLEGHLPGVSPESQRKTLGCKIRNYGRTFTSSFSSISVERPEDKKAEDNLPPPNPLVLYESPEDAEVKVTIEVDPMLSRFLRDHQRQGVKFVFDCLMGLKDFNGRGCILADDMGLGKTLQSITVMWTLLRQGINGRPAARKCAIICPASLVNNWESEINKWLKGNCPCTAVSDSSKEKVVSKFTGFKYDRRSNVLISSYETFRTHVSKLDGVPIDLVICDEAHRLKNDKTLTAVAIQKLPARMRLMLSGTPIQNDLNEFYSLISLCNPDVLGDVSAFRKTYANPIIIGREPDATKQQQQLASERLAELSEITNQFILRRTNTLLSKVLPPKVNMNVFCRLTEKQETIYKAFTSSGTCNKLVNSSDVNTAKTLAVILSLMKLCNHPCLVKPGSSIKSEVADKELRLIQEQYTSNTKSRSCYPEYSAKILLLYRLLYNIRKSSNDRIVIISNYTQTLDVFERLCKQCNYPQVRLDGSLSIKKRHQLVTTFNDPNSNSFVFLLSSKAGGCGINLIGANRLVLFDPDWNPANDKQALARVWRDGQRKTCYIYRFFSTGTIEEKIYQRQICKDGLSAMLVTDGINEMKDSLSGEYLRNLFEYKGESSLSDTHDSMSCERCTPDVRYVPQTEDFLEEELITWAHHTDLKTVPDPFLKQAIFENNPPIEGVENFQPVSFVMSSLVEFSDKPPQPKKAPEVAPKVKEQDKVTDQDEEKDEEAQDEAKGDEQGNEQGNVQGDVQGDEQDDEQDDEPVKETKKKSEKKTDKKSKKLVNGDTAKETRTANATKNAKNTKNKKEEKKVVEEIIVLDDDDDDGEEEYQEETEEEEFDSDLADDDDD